MSAAEVVLEGLDPEQRAAASAVRGPVVILAGAGTGKTRAITHRIAYAVRTEAVPAGQLLAVTFTARAAGELRARLRNLGAQGVQARTFHAAALRQLQYFAPRVLGGAMPEVIANPIRLVGNAAARARLRLHRTELLAQEHAAHRAIGARGERKTNLVLEVLHPERCVTAAKEHEPSVRFGMNRFGDVIPGAAVHLQRHRAVARCQGVVALLRMQVLHQERVRSTARDVLDHVDARLARDDESAGRGFAAPIR